MIISQSLGNAIIKEPSVFSSGTSSLSLKIYFLQEMPESSNSFVTCVPAASHVFTSATRKGFLYPSVSICFGRRATAFLSMSTILRFVLCSSPQVQFMLCPKQSFRLSFFAMINTSIVIDVLLESFLHLLLWLIFLQSHPNFINVRLKNLDTTDKKSSHKIKHKKIPRVLLLSASVLLPVYYVIG